MDLCKLLIESSSTSRTIHDVIYSFPRFDESNKDDLVQLLKQSAIASGFQIFIRTVKPSNNGLMMYMKCTCNKVHLEESNSRQRQRYVAFSLDSDTGCTFQFRIKFTANSANLLSSFSANDATHVGHPKLDPSLLVNPVTLLDATTVDVIRHMNKSKISSANIASFLTDYASNLFNDKQVENLISKMKEPSAGTSSYSAAQNLFEIVQRRYISHKFHLFRLVFVSRYIIITFLNCCTNVLGMIYHTSCYLRMLTPI